MSISKARYGIGPPKSTNKYGRSNRRHFARQNHRKKTSDQYLKRFKNVVLSSVQIVGFRVQVDIPEVRDGAHYLRRG